jgi:hypothetical protein
MTFRDFGMFNMAHDLLGKRGCCVPCLARFGTSMPRPFGWQIEREVLKPVPNDACLSRKAGPSMARGKSNAR